MIMILIAIVALVIFGIMAVYGVYLLSDMFSAQHDKAIYTASLYGGQQIEGAIRAYNAEIGSLPTTATPTQTVQMLIDTGYLRNLRPGVSYAQGAIPATVWAVQGNRAYTPLTDINQCSRLNKFAGMAVSGSGAPSDGCPPCNDAAYDQYPACIGVIE